MKNWTFTELDRRMADGLQAQLPPMVFDVHEFFVHSTRQALAGVEVA